MKAYLFSTCLTVLFFLTACNKDDDNHNPVGITKFLSHYTTTLFPDTVNIDYNSQDQIIHTESSEDRTTIDISGSQLHYVDFRKTENREVANATFTMNGGGNVISGQGSFSYVANAPYTSQFTFTYDGQGNLIKRIDARSNGITWTYEYTWTNGDLTKVKWINGDFLYLTQFIEYDTNKEDKNKLDGYKFLTITNSFFGNSSQHLRKRIYDNFDPGSTIVHEYAFSYILDTDGYPVTETIRGISNQNDTDILNYHYQ